MSQEEYPRVYLYRRIVQAKLFIDAHYAENIDLGDIASEAYFSKFHFIRLFKNIYGKTPHQYLRSVRIERAMELLGTEIQVSDVCLMVGFKSFTTFSGLFKRAVGLSPSAYLLRKQNVRARIMRQPLDFIPGCFAEARGRKNRNFEDVHT